MEVVKEKCFAEENASHKEHKIESLDHAMCVNKLAVVGDRDRARSCRRKEGNKKKGLNKLEEYYMLLQDSYFYADLSCFGRYIISHPVLRWILLGVIATLFTPFFLFIIFTIVNAIFAFIGFMWIQVAVLVIGVSIFGCILFWMLTALLMIGLYIFCAYYAVRYTSQFFKTNICN